MSNGIRYFQAVIKKVLPILVFVLFLGACDSVNRIFTAGKDIPDETKPNIELEDEEPDPADTIPDVEPKIKKNEFYGIKTKKSFIRRDTRTQLILELFNYIKEPTEVPSYVRQVYYHDRDGGRIASVVGRGQTLERVLHGPYKRTVNDIVVEEGMFYKGTKHEIWLNQQLDSVLYEKEHFHQGWYRDSEIIYYNDATKEKIKEVIPIRYGKKEGDYFRFFENGNIAVTGRYEFDKKVGVWSEYHNIPEVVRVKREIQYPSQFHLKGIKPFVKREWNRNAQLIYTAEDPNQ